MGWQVNLVDGPRRFDPWSMAQDQVHRLADLSVAFISLVEAPANQRSLLVKSASADQQVFERQVVIVKQDVARRIAYGLVLVPDEVDDWRDTSTAEEIEKAAYAFMLAGRTQQIDADHDGEVKKGFVAESWIVRQGDPLFAKEPEGAWVVGIKVIDEATWKPCYRREDWVTYRTDETTPPSPETPKEGGVLLGYSLLSSDPGC